MSKVRLLVGTRKGAFVLTADGTRAMWRSWAPTSRRAYPITTLGPLASTKMACPGDISESAYFAALEAVASRSATGDELVLSKGSGRELLHLEARE